MRIGEGNSATSPDVTAFTLQDPRRRGERKWAENAFEVIIVENFPNLGKKSDIHIQEAQRAPNKVNPRRSTPRHIVTKVAKRIKREF